MGAAVSVNRRAIGRLIAAVAAGCVLLVWPGAAGAQERMFFPAIHDPHHDAQAEIRRKIAAESVRLDIAVWLLGDREISTDIVNKHKSGVLVRVIGDRAAIFESDPNTRVEFEYLAQNGVPIRLRSHPTWFPEIMHWKSAIFVGQQLVEFGSANWTNFELKPWSPTNFKDETVMFTNDPALFRAFLTTFDDMWVDSRFEDWSVAYRRETGRDWTTRMDIPPGRQELVRHETNVPGMVWSQGSELNTRLAAEIDREHARIDMVIYRLSDPVISDALIRRKRANVPVRVFIEPLQYREGGFPEYWLTGARIDQLWAADIDIRQRVHEGLTHMKTLITSHVALNGSSNFTRNWQRDHNYFIPAAQKPALHAAMRDRFEAMWADTVNYGPFRPQRPSEPMPTAPAEGSANVGVTPRLEWGRTPWAVSFDVYLGTSPSALAFQGRVDAQLVEDPPATYSWTPPAPLQGETTYYWRVVARTFATDVDPSVVTGSVIRSFRTGTGGPTITSFTPNVALPAAEGTTITWTANATGGTAPNQYQFWRFTADTGWTLAQDYSTRNTFSWAPPAGTHALQVWVRSAGSSAAYDTYAGTGFFTITPPGPRLTSFTANVAFPASAHAPITWTAAATGGSGAIEYQFWRHTAGGGWTLAQDYSPQNTFTWAPPAGTHAVQVWVRSRGSTEAFQDWRSTGFFEVTAGAARLTGFSPNVSLPGSPGTPMTWTATASGSRALEYQFWRYSSASGVWSMVRDWSPSNQFTWTPAAHETGLYALQVWVRHAGTGGAAWEDWTGSGYFSVTTSSGLTLAADRSLASVRHDDVVTWTATVIGGSGAWEYQYWLYDGSSWISRPYSTERTLTWRLSAGTRAVQVWVRPVGSSAPWERWETTGLFEVRP